MTARLRGDEVKVDWTKLLFQTINLSVMGLILYRLLFKSVLRALDERTRRVTTVLDDAERRERAAADSYTQYQERLAQIQDAIASMRQESDEELWRTRTHVLAETRREIEKMQAKAGWGITEARQRGIAKYQRQLGRLVTSLSGRLVREVGGNTFQEACIGQFIEQLSTLPADEYRADELYPHITQVDGEQVIPVQLSSAYVLSAASATQLEKQIQEMVGRPVKVTYRVDPVLVAGATIRIRDIVIDGSVAGTLRGLYEQYVTNLRQSPEIERSQHLATL
jgi:F0F1-type ATP synthase membrane subunit b/b'